MICFATTIEINGVNKLAGAFWISYGFIMVSLVVHLVFTWFVLTDSSRAKRILNMPVIIVSCVEIIIMVLVGMVCMFVPNMSNRVAFIVCGAVLGFSIISLVAIRKVGEHSMNANDNLNEATGYYRELVNNSELLISVAKSMEIKTIITKVADTIRYSDPMSSDATYVLELEINVGINQLLELVKENKSIELIQEKVDEVLLLIEQRNNKCKVQKRKHM